MLIYTRCLLIRGLAYATISTYNLAYLFVIDVRFTFSFYINGFLLVSLFFFFFKQKTAYEI